MISKIALGIKEKFIDLPDSISFDKLKKLILNKK
tara:strand:- start:375 stop:476 length:102 start_codon:yes stop_codon:yes gene_type:complete